MFSKFVERLQPAVQTHAAVSQKSRLYAHNARDQQSYIGAISNFQPSQGRSTEAIKGIGAGDIHIELVPNFSDIYTFSVETALFYLRNAFQVFGYKGGVDGLVRALRHHRYPFDVKQEIAFSEIAQNDEDNTKADTIKDVTIGGATYKALVTYYEACWIVRYSNTYGTDRSVIGESLEINCTDIFPIS